MNQTKTINHWHEVSGGFRSSFLLRLGTLALALGVLGNLGTRLLAGPGDPSNVLLITSWLFFILGMWIMAAGFTWVGASPFFSRFGFLVGFFFAAQGIQLLVVLFTFTPATVPPVSLTVGRLLSLLVFAGLERHWLSQRTTWLLVGVVTAQLLKVAARELGYLPDLGVPLDPLLDAVLLLAVAAALFQFASGVREVENEWAQEIYEMGHSDLADFNNPEHDWNKSSARSRK